MALGTSDYATRLAESVYSAALQALVFVYSAAPAVSPEEAGALGPEWPSPQTLFDLQVRSQTWKSEGDNFRVQAD